ncbi:hypothetical protein N7456_007234 [Penicillium angulare]|uniref:Uncharacterized protein n=1 Tax=Penicillium angulare TaxID=116970 RepID=A0A9W9FJN1_9EURO|nr:hypothetical protein N7456_007234 [Penicillium angulare]
MSAANEFANTDEPTEPLDSSISRPDTHAAAGKQSASHRRERIARAFEPGDTRATTRRMSDTPASGEDHFLDEDEDGMKGVKEEPQSVLGTVHELVAKALGGGSRGGS